MVNGEVPDTSIRPGAIIKRMIDGLLKNGESLDSIAAAFSAEYQIAKIKHDEELLRQARVSEIAKAIEYYVNATYGDNIYSNESIFQLAMDVADVIDNNVAATRKAADRDGEQEKYRTATPADRSAEDPDPQSIINAFVRKL